MKPITILTSQVGCANLIGTFAPNVIIDTPHRLYTQIGPGQPRPIDWKENDDV